MEENQDRKIKKGLILTLTYYGVQNCPLTLPQILRYLFLFKNEKDLSFFEIEKYLETLKNKNFIKEENGLFFLKSKEESISLTKFMSREKESQKKINKVRKALQIMTFLPFLKNVFLCGSVARKTANRKSDIDFLILTEKNRIWFVRFFLTVLVFFLGKKTPTFGQRKDKFCLNHYRTDKKLEIEKSLKDIYSASEYSRMLNLYSDQSEKKFFKENKNWLNGFEPFFDSKKPALFRFKKSQRLKNFLKEVLSGRLGDFLELGLKKIQKSKIAKNLKKREFPPEARLVTKNNVIMFHLSPKSPLLIEKIKSSLLELGELG